MIKRNTSALILLNLGKVGVNHFGIVFFKFDFSNMPLLARAYSASNVIRLSFLQTVIKIFN